MHMRPIKDDRLTNLINKLDLSEEETGYSIQTADGEDIGVIIRQSEYQLLKAISELAKNPKEYAKISERNYLFSVGKISEDFQSIEDMNDY